jgi:hypothetical protein
MQSPGSGARKQKSKLEESRTVEDGWDDDRCGIGRDLLVGMPPRVQKAAASERKASMARRKFLHIGNRTLSRDNNRPRLDMGAVQP